MDACRRSARCVTHLRGGAATLYRLAELLIAAFIIGGIFCLAVVVIVRSRVVAPLERLAAGVERLREPSESRLAWPSRARRASSRRSAPPSNAMLQEHEQHQAHGLGVAIVRRLVTLMGGEVRLDSEVGRGSTFTVAVALKRAPAPAELGGDAAHRTGALFCAMNVTAENRERRRAVGMDEIAAKPISQARLFDLVLRAQRANQTAARKVASQ